MSYQVLARKWRPRAFSDLAGQDTVVRTLTHALTHQRLHHAYLFTGTRGVGKTTLGRLIAKCMNCEQGISPTPCNQCTICKEIDAGNFVDLIEVDAASRTKVEDTRELLDNVQYTPSYGRFKIYLIDEVHMLSGHSFNALLKTLEEPPAHVKFIFATTDPERLPETVLSRCLQFHLRNISTDVIAAYLEKVLTAENITYESAALARLAFAADGSMRDALSLLDQAIAYGQGKLSEADIKAMLGSIEHDDLIHFLDAIAQQDTNALHAALQQLALYHCDYHQATHALLGLLHYLALLQIMPTMRAEFYTQHAEKLAQLAKQFSPEEVQLLYQIALMGRRDLPLAPTAKSGFEMLVIRLFTFKPAHQESNSTEKKVIKDLRTPQTVPTAAPVTRTVAPAPPPTRTTPAAKPAPAAFDASSPWDVLVTQLKLTGMSQLLAQHCSLEKMENHQIDLFISSQQQPLLNPGTQERLANALAAHFGKPIKLNIKISDKNLPTPAGKKDQAEKAKQQVLIDAVTKDENVQALLSAFNGQIQPDSIERTDS